MSPDVERELIHFLAEQRAADFRGEFRKVGESVDRLRDLMLEHAAEDREHFAELRGDDRGLSLRVGALEKSGEKLEDKVEESDRWNIEELQKQTEQHRESAEWMRRNWLPLAVGVVCLSLQLFALIRR